MKYLFVSKLALACWLILVITPVDLQAHPIKMSTAKIYGSQESDALFLTINFFEDDLLTHIRDLYQIPVFKYGDNNDLLHESLTEYVNEYLKIKMNDKPTSFEIIESDKQQENVITVRFKIICFVSITCIRQLTIENKILFDGFKEQTNIMVLELNDLNERKNLRFFRHQPVHQVEFKTSSDCKE